MLTGTNLRADIARHTALTGQTISNRFKELLELGPIM